MRILTHRLLIFLTLQSAVRFHLRGSHNAPNKPKSATYDIFKEVPISAISSSNFDTQNAAKLLRAGTMGSYSNIFRLPSLVRKWDGSAEGQRRKEKAEKKDDGSWQEIIMGVDSNHTHLTTKTWCLSGLIWANSSEECMAVDWTQTRTAIMTDHWQRK